jgi:hypothetical protein
MIINFEEYTEPLTDYERDTLLPVIVAGLRTKTEKDLAITNVKMCRALREAGYRKLNEPRMRKIINHIRVNGLIKNLVASSKGYWIEEDIEERKKYVKSIKQRAASMMATL